MAEHRDSTFHNRTLVLDGECFQGCRFINADLRYKGTAPFEVQDCRFGGTLNLEFARDGAGAADLIEMLDRELAGLGYDLRLAALMAQAKGPVWRFHTWLPRLPRSERR